MLPWTWLGKAWSGLVLVRNDQKINFQTQGTPATCDWASSLWLQQHSESALFGTPCIVWKLLTYFVQKLLTCFAYLCTSFWRVFASFNLLIAKLFQALSDKLWFFGKIKICFSSLKPKTKILQFINNKNNQCGASFSRFPSRVLLTGICRGTQLTNPSHKRQLSKATNVRHPFLNASSQVPSGESRVCDNGTFVSSSHWTLHAV